MIRGRAPERGAKRTRFGVPPGGTPIPSGGDAARRSLAAVLAAGALSAALLLAGCAGGRLRLGPSKEGEVVDAEGWAPADRNDPIGTKRRALAEAQKKAVERVLGVYISAKTRVEQSVSVDQKILANTSGYIRKYDVVQEREEEGFLKVRIRALVLYRKVGEDLKSLGLVRPDSPPGNPKVAVLVRGKGTYAEAWGARASEAVRRGLLERGFSVIDLADKTVPRGAAVKSTDAVTAASAGLKLQADLMVTGEVEAHPIEDARLGDFHSYRAQVSLQAVKPATGELVSLKSHEASGIDPTPEIAANKAVENAGQLAGQALASELASTLKARLSVVVRVEGLGGLDRIQRMAEDLRLTPGVTAASLSAYRGGMAELLVVTDDMPGEDLAAALLQMRQFRFRLRVVTPYEVELEGS